MLTLQVVQVPELPPMPEVTNLPLWMTMPPHTLALIALGMTAGVVIVLWPIMRAIGRRLEGKREDPMLRREIDELRGRLGEVDALQHRVAELEERIDFTERVLAQRGAPEQLNRG